jgi:hypothetical protein
VSYGYFFQNSGKQRKHSHNTMKNWQILFFGHTTPLIIVFASLFLAYQLSLLHGLPVIALA